VEWGAIAGVVPEWVDGEGVADVAGDSLRAGGIGGGRVVVRVQYGAVEHSLVLVDGEGCVLGALAVGTRGTVFTGDLDGDGRAEVVLETIEGNALSIHPRTWRVLRVTESGFEEVLAVPRSFSYSEGKEERVCVDNRVGFDGSGGVEVRNVVFVPGCAEALEPYEVPWPDGTPGWPSAQGQTWTLRMGGVADGE